MASKQKRPKKRKVSKNRKQSSSSKVSPLSKSLNKWWDRDSEISKKQQSIFLWLAAAAFLLLVLISTGVGLNGDDDVQSNYATALPSYYSSFGKDTSVFTAGPEIKYYGGLFEILTEVTNRSLGFDRSDPAYFTVRQIWNIFFGVLTIFFCALLAGRIGGFIPGVLVFAALILSPRFMGHSIINPKDIPFAAGYTITLYYLYQLLSQMPSPNRSTYIGLIVGIGMSVGIRINGGFLLIGYLGLAMASYYLIKYGLSTVAFKTKNLILYTKAFLISSLGGLVLGLFFWPYGLENPIRHIPESMKAFANFQTLIKVLFKGEMVWSNDVPLEYLSNWMLYTIPIFILAGFVASLIFIKNLFRKYNPIGLVMVQFAFLFPLVYVLIQNSALYDGWRHFTFTYPSLVILSILSLITLTDLIKSKKPVLYGIIALLAITALDPLLFSIRNPSFLYTYFNPINGGVKKAYGNFELDYWGTSVKKAVKWMEEEGIISPDMQDSVVIASNFSHALNVYLRKKYDKVSLKYQRYRNRNDAQYDYAIWVNRFIDGSYLRNGHWPTSKTIHQIQLNGKIPIAIIEKEDPEHLAFQCAQAVTRRNWDLAIDLCNKELEKYPDNEVAWLNLGLAHLSKNDYAAAKPALDKGLSITPEGLNALNFMGIYYLNTNNIDMALSTFEDAVWYHHRNTTGYYYKAFILANQQQLSEALEAIQECITANPQFANCYDLGARIHEQLGDTRSAQAFRNALSQIRGN